MRLIIHPSSRLKRACTAFALAALLTFSTLLFAGCSASVSGTSNSSGSSTSGSSLPTREIVIATMITEDILPFWVAEAESVFKEHGLKARVETFQSAQELTAAVTSGDVDFAMTDPLVAATLTAGGVPLTMKWVTLGATADQGRFGLMTRPESGITSLEQLAGKPIGVAENTMLEYMMDKLLLEAGVPQDQIIVEQIPKIPVRYEMMRSGQVPAAALPGTLLTLGEMTGMVLIADDTKGDNLTQSVMTTRSEYANSAEGAAVIDVLREVWNECADKINASPESYRKLLIEKASLPEAIQNEYPISTYPQAALPTSAMIDPMLQWMNAKGYLAHPVSYDPTTGDLKVS